MDHFDIEFEKIRQRYNCSDINKIELLRQQLSEGGRPFVLYGAGKMGRANARFCKENNIAVACFCDKNMQGKVLLDIPVYSPEQLKNSFKNPNIVICSVTFYDEIIKECLALGFKKENIVLDFPQQIGNLSMEQFISHVEGYKWAYDFFEEEQSKKIILSKINNYLFHDEMERSSSPTYFEKDKIFLSGQEVFVDAGGYIGDTIDEFLNVVGDKYKKVYSFEPDSKNREILLKKYGNNSKIEIIDKGLWNEVTTVQFVESGSVSSMVDEQGTVLVAMTSLDEFFKDYTSDQLPTYIKMDVEGAEENLILGAKNLIKNTRPKLAVSVYHKPEDLYRLTRLINELCPNYQMILRHYTNDFYDTVLYALPTI